MMTMSQGLPALRLPDPISCGLADGRQRRVVEDSR